METYQPTALDANDYMQHAAIRDVCECIENPLIDHEAFMKELTWEMTKSYLKKTIGGNNVQSETNS
jgi:hypothetical protein